MHLSDCQVVAKVGRVDVLVNNGGRSQRALIESTALQVDMDMLALNTIGAAPHTTTQLVSHLQCRHHIHHQGAAADTGQAGRWQGGGGELSDGQDCIASLSLVRPLQARTACSESMPTCVNRLIHYW